MIRSGSRYHSAPSAGMSFISKPDNRPVSPYIYLTTDSPVPQKKPFLKWPLVIMAVFIVVLIVAITAVSTIPSNSHDEEAAKGADMEAFFADQDVTDGYSYEAASDEEDNLNTLYASVAFESPYASYKTTLDHTSLLEYGPTEVCALLSISCSDLAFPEELSSFEKVTALNTNALDYYLDNGHIVIISAYGDFPYTSSGGTVVVYAANYAQGQAFTAFIPPSAGNVSYLIELRRDALINGIVGVPNCYVSKEVF